MAYLSSVLARSRKLISLLTALLGLALLILAGFSTSQAVQTPAPGAPPAWPQQPALIQDEEKYHLFLPLVHRTTDAPAPWVDTQDRAASRTFYLEEYLGSETSDAGWTGDHASCDPGETSAAFREAILRRINYFRSMAGMPSLTGLNPEYTAKAQAAALMMSVNRTLSHSPDPSWKCYSEAGDEAAGSSNLYLGVYGPAAISGYMYDPGSGNYFVGHRRWILYPQTQEMGTGDIPPLDGYPAANALWVFDLEHMWGPRPEIRQPFIAWPPPGYVPYLVVYPRWSFAFPEADFSQAKVSMTRSGGALALVQNEPEYGYGENTLVWEPQASFTTPPAADTSYGVTVSNVLVDGQARSFSYTVILFTP